MKTVRILLALAFAVVASPGAEAQTPTTGAVAVHVVDGTGAPLVDVLVTLNDSMAGEARFEVTAREGRVDFPGLRPGDYSLTAERIGFAPRRITGIRVLPEGRTSLRVALGEAAVGGAAVTSSVAEGLADQPGAAWWVPGPILDGLPTRTRAPRDLARFFAVADESFAAEGLPSGLSSLTIDGMPYRAATHPAADGSTLALPTFALAGFGHAGLLLNAPDVERSGAASTLLSMITLPGSLTRQGDVWASVAAGAESTMSYDGGVSLSGAAGDNGGYSVGVSALRLETGLTAAWPEPDGDYTIMEPGDGGSLAGYQEPLVVSGDVISGYGFLEYPVSSQHSIEVGVHGSTASSWDVVDQVSGAALPMEGTDLYSGVGLLSSLGPDLGNEFRIGLAVSDRALTEGTALPFTMIANDALSFGTSPRLGSARDAGLRIANAVHYRSGRHTLKAGIAVESNGHEYDQGDARIGSYLFGDSDQLTAGTGVFAGFVGTAPIADWTERTFAAFVQDRFEIADGLVLTAGVRMERSSLSADVRRDTAWTTLTGIANDSIDVFAPRFSPRASLSWDIGARQRWVLHVAAGLYHDRLDPLLMAGWQSDDGTTDVRRLVGAVAWPSTSGPGGSDGITVPRLTLLGPGFEAPRTARLTGGIATRIAAGTTLRVTTSVRRTQNLPRRTDLNLVPLAVARDQHGREVFGTLVQQGGLVAAEPGSNRRFTTYDEVAVITADGTSDHLGVTFDIQHDAGAVSLLGQYTFGRTTDDWFAGAARGWTMTAPNVGEGWVDGPSDLDVPHRAVLAALVDAPAGLRLGVAYRLQSGRPFTPGFRPGVDANGDGDAYNDPAFIDESIAGMSDLLGDHPCLREHTGEFAGRNSCRTGMVHALDLTGAIPLFSVGGATAEATLGAFDVLESAFEVPDAAVYLIDPAGTVTTDPVARTVTLPLMANPGFGDALTRRTPGRSIRIGLSFKW